jgi:DNA-binding NarL/FixJ family response regulator
MSTQESYATPLYYTVIIWDNRLARDSLARCLRYADDDCFVSGYGSVHEWLEADGPGSDCVVVLCATGRRATELAVRRDLRSLKVQCADCHVVIVSDIEGPDHVVEALESGAKGYIQMNSSIDVAIEAIRLVRVGGTFAPPGALLPSSGEAVGSPKERHRFTDRQVEVIKAMRLGKPNKIIAYELNMRECTVKVHIRNIMKALNAKNRTEVAYLTNALFSDADEVDMTSRPIPHPVAATLTPAK